MGLEAEPVEVPYAEVESLLRGAEVIVLDESFAAMDPETLRQALRCVLKRAPTLLVIAHP